MHVATPPAAPLMSAADGKSTRNDALDPCGRCFGCLGSAVCIVCAQVGLHACRSSGGGVRGAEEVLVYHVL